MYRFNPATWFALMWCAIAACVSSVGARAEEAASVEYKIKAAYLLNFTKFVEWPTNRFPAPTAPIRVGVLGKDPFGDDLDQTMSGRVIENRKFEIVRLEEAEAAVTCHIVFISSSERRRLPQIVETLHKAGVLTVGEHEQFVEQGGIIRFFLHEDTVRFEINARAADSAGLRISSKLMQIARPEGDKR
jgi:YfiR/HmsC-like